MRLIAVCLWSLQEALHILDHSDLVLAPSHAEAGSPRSSPDSQKGSTVW